jgi:hypothetical protein
VAFGFHVNLYHSYRIDTNDEDGFGKDIRIIRHLIRTLDRFNQMGVPVKAVWDFDNLFSLQNILPRYAPDIISDIRRRVQNNGDEVILMSYNNGLVSAMTREEFIDAMQMAVTNDYGSGVRDLFGQFSPIVRPQEMMTTPGNFGLYKELGIDYISLYYSATSFDAFRMFSRPLSQAEAYNPILYRHPETKEGIGVIPTYHIGDLIENTGLKYWAEKLHRKQLSGEIGRDVLIFINFDADTDFWCGIDAIRYPDLLPNTGGIAGLIRDVENLRWVKFTNLADYLKHHPPKGEFYFSQDTADGSFNGYNSWAEKAQVTAYWKQISNNRRVHTLARRAFQGSEKPLLPEKIKKLIAESNELRLKVLSTTNFGLAAPQLARQREQEMALMLSAMNHYSDIILQAVGTYFRSQLTHRVPEASLHHSDRLIDTFLIVNENEGIEKRGSHWLHIHLPSDDYKSFDFYFVAPKGSVVPAWTINVETSFEKDSTELTLYVPKGYELASGIYDLYGTAKKGVKSYDTTASVFADTTVLKNRFIEIHFNSNKQVAKVLFNGEKYLDAGSLAPYIKHKEKVLYPQNLDLLVESSGEDGVASIRLQGRWDGPDGLTRIPGHVDYRLILMEDVPYLFVEGEVTYPDTFRNDILHVESPVLARKMDMGWKEAAPMELRFAHRADMGSPFHILKRNFLGYETFYPLDYFRHSNQNVNLANINNHITAEYIGVANTEHGMAIGMDTTVSANFAFCPFKMNYDHREKTFSINANPFGTYHGRQYRPPTWGNRLGYEAALLAGPQFQSVAPTYNGFTQPLSLMIAFFENEKVPEDIKQALISFAKPPFLVAARGVRKTMKDKRNIAPPAGFIALYHNGGMLFHWEKVGDLSTRYRIYCGSESGQYDRTYTADGTTFFAEDFFVQDGMNSDKKYYTVIEAVMPDGRVSPKSAEISFIAATSDHLNLPKVPIQFQAKYFWHSLNAWVTARLNF